MFPEQSSTIRVVVDVSSLRKESLAFQTSSENGEKNVSDRGEERKRCVILRQKVR